jgi:hypothetical protein
VALVNSVNPVRIEGQKTAKFRDRGPARCRPRTSTACRSATPATSPPTGRATASTRPRRPACGVSRPQVLRPIVRGCAGAFPPDDRHGHPHRQPGFVGYAPRPPATSRGGHRDGDRPADPRAYKLLAAGEGCSWSRHRQPGSRGCWQKHAAGELDPARRSCAPSRATGSRTRSGPSPVRRSRWASRSTRKAAAAELGLHLMPVVVRGARHLRQPRPRLRLPGSGAGVARPSDVHSSLTTTAVSVEGRVLAEVPPALSTSCWRVSGRAFADVRAGLLPRWLCTCENRHPARAWVWAVHRRPL